MQTGLEIVVLNLDLAVDVRCLVETHWTRVDFGSVSVHTVVTVPKVFICCLLELAELVKVGESNVWNVVVSWEVRVLW